MINRGKINPKLGVKKGNQRDQNNLGEIFNITSNLERTKLTGIL